MIKWGDPAKNGHIHRQFLGMALDFSYQGRFVSEKRIPKSTTVSESAEKKGEGVAPC